MGSESREGPFGLQVPGSYLEAGSLTRAQLNGKGGREEPSLQAQA